MGNHVFHERDVSVLSCLNDDQLTIGEMCRVTKEKPNTL